MVVTALLTTVVEMASPKKRTPGPPTLQLLSTIFRSVLCWEWGEDFEAGLEGSIIGIECEQHIGSMQMVVEGV